MTNLFKYLYLICGCLGLAGAYFYFTQKSSILFVVVPFIACLIFRMLYLKNAAQD